MPQRSGGGKLGLILIALLVLFGGGGGLSGLFGGTEDIGVPQVTSVPYTVSQATATPRRTNAPVYTAAPAEAPSVLSGQTGSGLNDLLSLFMGYGDTDNGYTDVSGLAALFSESHRDA